MGSQSPDRTSSGWLSRIAAQRIGAPESRWPLLPLNDVAYGFTAAVVRAGLIAVRQTETPLSEDVAYVCTVKGSVYRTGFRSIAALERKLDPERFVRVSRGLFVNLNRLVELDLSARTPLVGVAVGGAIEYLPISRRALREIRAIVGLRVRLPRAPRNAADGPRVSGNGKRPK